MFPETDELIALHKKQLYKRGSEQRLLLENRSMAKQVLQPMVVVSSGGLELKKFDPAAANMNSFYPQKGNKNTSGVPLAFAASDAVRKMKRNSSTCLGGGVSQPAACKKH